MSHSKDPVSALRLVNGSAGDPAVYLDFPGQDNAVQFDAGELHRLDPVEVRDIGIVLLSHLHMDHFVGFDRILRSTIDREKTVYVCGPVGTIGAVEKKLGAYVHHRFPFMKVRYEVVELGTPEESGSRASFDCQEGFVRRDLDRHSPGKGRVVLDTSECRVRFAQASHTAPCVSYAVDIKRGYRFDPTKARSGVLRPGPWVKRVLEEVRKPKASRVRMLSVDGEGGRFSLKTLLEGYFTFEKARRIGFVTDTRIDRQTHSGLVELVEGAWRLYGDSYYAADEEVKAEKYGHMTTEQVAGLARDAGVEQLMLIHFATRYRGRYDVLFEEARACFPNTYAELPERSRIHERHSSA